MSRAREIAAGVVCLVVGAAVIVGVPIALIVAVGWPLPTQVPTVDAIGDALAGRSPIDPSTYTRAIAAVIWVAWAQVALAIAVEARAAIAGRVARPLPGLAVTQTAAAALVTTIALVWPTGPAAHAGAVTAPVVLVEPPPTFPSAQIEPAPRGGVDVVEHRVVRHDTLWGLAEDYLGSGQRWGELFAINRGRPQVGGDALATPGVLRPGWIILIPNDATADAAREVTVEPGDTLGDLALDHLGSIDARHALFDANKGHLQPDGGRLQDPDLIRPGWTLRLPGDPTNPASTPHSDGTVDVPSAIVVTPVDPPAELDAADATIATPAGTPALVAPTAPEGRSTDAPTRPTDADDHSDHDDHDEGSHGLDAGMLGAAGAVLAAGVGALVAIGRRRQQIRRRPGEHIPHRGEDIADVDDAIACSDSDLVERADHALRLLADALVDADTVPQPLLATIDGATIELLLDRPHPSSPSGWTADGAGHLWTHPLQPGSPDVADRTAPLPTLIAVGALHEGGVLLDLEAQGLTAVTGDPDAVTATAASIAVELAATPFADVHDVVLVGIDVPAATNLGATAATLADAINRAQSAADIVAKGLAATGAATAFELRCRAPHEAWPACTVLVHADAIGDDPDAFDRLVAIAAPGGQGVAVVALGANPAGSLHIHVATDHLVIDRFGLHCGVQQLSPAAATAVDAAVVAAALDPVPAPPDTPTLFDEAATTDDDGDTSHDPDERIVVRLLGPVGVDGHAGAVKPQQLAMLTYLVVHPNATGDALRDAVWRGRPPSQERFLNAVHELRRTLGARHLPPSSDGRYRLVDVTTDLADFHARLAEGTDNAEQLRRALELVGGVPFSYDSRHRRHFTWVDHHNHATNAERVVGEAAHRLAVLALDDNDVQLAAWAAQQGLRASPGNETLTGDLMAAHLAAGDTRTAERVLAEYERTLDELGLDDSDALHDLLAERRAS